MTAEKKYRPYIIRVYKVEGDEEKQVHQALEPATSATSARKSFAKKYAYFDKDNYTIKASIMATPGWKFFMERMKNASDSKS